MCYGMCMGMYVQAGAVATLVRGLPAAFDSVCSCVLVLSVGWVVFWKLAGALLPP